MKRTFLFFGLLIFISLFADTCFSQRKFSYSILKNGYWGEWENTYSYIAQGSYDEFIIYSSGSHPSTYNFRVKLYSMKLEKDKNERKRRIKNNESYEYSGLVEYYLDYGNYSKIEKNIILFPQLINSSFPNTTLYSSPATIRIAPYKDEPLVYNIFFNNVGVAIQFAQ